MRVLSRWNSEVAIPLVDLSDGYLWFVDDDFRLHSTYSTVSPKSIEERELTYADICEFVGIDLIKTFQDAGLSAHSVPSAEDFWSQSYWMTDDERYAGRELQKGTCFGGINFSLFEVIDPEIDEWQKRSIYLNVIETGQHPDLSHIETTYRNAYNSSIGDIPVYIQYYEPYKPSLGSFYTESFFARFEINGRVYGILMDGYTQQEFVEMLLAIVNAYD